MRTNIIHSFTSSLSAAGAEYILTTTEKFETSLSTVIDPPAVGAPLDIDGLSFEDTTVQTPPTPRLLLEAETGVSRVHGGITEHGSFVIQSDAARFSNQLKKLLAESTRFLLE